MAKRKTKARRTTRGRRTRVVYRKSKPAVRYRTKTVKAPRRKAPRRNPSLLKSPAVRLGAAAVAGMAVASYAESSESMADLGGKVPGGTAAVTGIMLYLLGRFAFKGANRSMAYAAAVGAVGRSVLDWMDNREGSSSAELLMAPPVVRRLPTPSPAVSQFIRPTMGATMKRSTLAS